MKKSLEAVAGDEKKEKGVAEYFDIYQDLRGRFADMMAVMIEDIRGVDDIKVDAGKLNLAYERQEPWAIEIFRKMVCDCLTGVQETLSTYGVQHDRFDFESELGWEGSNAKVLEIMQNSDYYVPQTQCNDKGVPQGAYLDMAGFITDMGFKIGKGGYQKEYPPLYVLRPDGSTLYTYRDIVYSFKKASMSDLILNIICSEQDLAQQKVALAMAMMNPEMEGQQYHLSYDLVKLTTGKMSGRRGRYLLADDLYEDLKEVIREKMDKKYKEKGEDISAEMFDTVTHEVSTAAMKYALLSVSCMTQINFDIAKITDFEDASAPFILYNSTRLNSVIRKFNDRAESGVLEKLCSIDSVDFTKLDDDREWALLLDFVLPFASMITDAAMPTLPKPPALPSYGMHRVCDFLNMFVRAASGWYGPAGVRMMPVQSQLDAGWNETASMHARIHACKCFKQVMDNGLRLLMIEPLERCNHRRLSPSLVSRPRPSVSPRLEHIKIMKSLSHDSPRPPLISMSPSERHRHLARPRAPLSAGSECKSSSRRVRARRDANARTNATRCSRTSRRDATRVGASRATGWAKMRWNDLLAKP